MATILFSNTNLSIEYIEGKDYLLLKWNGFAEGPHFKFLTNQILEAVEKTKSRALLSDNTHWNAISPNDLGWAANSWFPKAEEKGIRKLATVLSKDLFHRIAERSIEEMATAECMQIKNFRSMEDAEAWLIRSDNRESCLQNEPVVL